MIKIEIGDVFVHTSSIEEALVIIDRYRAVILVGAPIIAPSVPHESESTRIAEVVQEHENQTPLVP